MDDNKVYSARFLPQVRHSGSLTKDVEVTPSEEICVFLGALCFASWLVLSVRRYTLAQVKLKLFLVCACGVGVASLSRRAS